MKEKLLGSRHVHRTALSDVGPTMFNTEWHESLAKIESSSGESNMVERDVSLRKKKNEDDVLAKDGSSLKGKLLGSGRVHRRALSDSGKTNLTNFKCSSDESQTVERNIR